MANQIPLSGAAGASGGYAIPDAQGAMLANGILDLAGALSLAGDRRTTGSRKENFPIWLGQPTAGFVGEGAAKPVTGAELGQGVLNIKKVASIVLFTDEQLEDIANGDLNVLVDSGVRQAIAHILDAHAIGKENGTNLTTSFDSALRATTATVELANTGGDRLRLAVSAAMAKLEANGYRDQSQFGVILPADAPAHLRDARAAVETTTPIYDDKDPLYGLDRTYSSNLNTLGEAAGANKIVGFVVNKPNLHVRIRHDVRVKFSSEATVNDGSTDRKLYQEDLTGARYVTRQGFLVHDLNRSVVAITNAS